MDDELDELIRTVTHERLQALFLAVGSLPVRQTHDLARAVRAQRLGRFTRHLDPVFLTAVITGAWTATHEQLARDAHRWARACTARLPLGLHRRALVAALDAAALVVISDTDPDHPLPAPLACRLSRPWVEVTGEGLWRTFAA